MSVLRSFDLWKGCYLDSIGNEVSLETVEDFF